MTPRVGELWERGGRRWAVVWVGSGWVGFDNRVDSTSCKPGELDTRGWARVSASACLDVAPSVDTNIRVWPWDGAPASLRELSTNGGDEDWVALVPVGWDCPAWMEQGTMFGCCCVDRFEVLAGTVYIGSHA